MKLMIEGKEIKNLQRIKGNSDETEKISDGRGVSTTSEKIMSGETPLANRKYYDFKDTEDGWRNQRTRQTRAE